MIIIAVSLLIGAVSDKTAQEIETRHAKWVSAYKRMDVATLTSMLHPRFRIVTESGEAVTRKKYLQILSQSSAPEFYENDLLRVSRKGLEAHAFTEERTLRGQHVATRRYRDTWVLRSGHWLLRESKTLESL